jgi:hypothetical protein
VRLIGVSLMFFGAAVAWFLGVKAEDPATLRTQFFAFFHITDPGSVLPGASVPPAASKFNAGTTGVGAAVGGALGATRPQ